MGDLFFSDEDDEAYGEIKDFKNIENFKKSIEKQLGYKVKMSNIRVDKCIITSKGIPTDLLIPLSSTDVDIREYYIADIAEVESNKENEIEKLKADLRGKDNEIEDLKARIKYLKQFENKTYKDSPKTVNIDKIDTFDNRKFNR